MKLTDRQAAMPAAVAIGGCVLLTLIVGLRPATPGPAKLRADIDKAHAGGDEKTILLLQQHLAALEPDRAGHRFELARTLDRVGRRDEAAAVLRTLAPADGDGFAPAHLQLAEWAVEARVMGGRADADALREARRHAERAAADLSLTARAAELLRVLDGL